MAGVVWEHPEGLNKTDLRKAVGGDNNAIDEMATFGADFGLFQQIRGKEVLTSIHPKYIGQRAEFDKAFAELCDNQGIEPLIVDL